MTYNNILYFNTTRNYTLSILNALNNIKYWVNIDNEDMEFIVPIKFGNYEKSIIFEDVKEQYMSGNFNFLPRLVLSFSGMQKAPERITNKYKKFTKYEGDNINFTYNSVPYNFNYDLTLQARGLTEAFMIVEQILPLFRPSMPLKIKEFPLFQHLTETQLLISDPEFDINEEFENEDVNIMTVKFELMLKGNLYLPLELTGKIEKVEMYNHLMKNQNIYDSILESKYTFDIKNSYIENTEIEMYI